MVKLTSFAQDLFKMKAIGELIKRYPLLKKADLFKKIHTLEAKEVTKNGLTKHCLIFPINDREKMLFQASFENETYNRPSLSTFRWSYKIHYPSFPSPLQNSGWALNPFFLEAKQEITEAQKELINPEKQKEEFFKNKNKILSLQHIITETLINNPYHNHVIHAFYENLKEKQDPLNSLNALFTKVNKTIAYKPLASLKKWWEINKEKLLEKTEKERSQTIRKYLLKSQKLHFYKIETTIEPEIKPLFKALFERLATPCALSIQNQLHESFSIQKHKNTEFGRVLATIASLQKKTFDGKEESLEEKLKKELFLLRAYCARENHKDSVLESNFFV
jgi:hypothetical protein